jgi:pyruvate formate lyase activating enzyme
MREALFQTQLDDGRVLCTLCPHDCRLADGQRGACGVRIQLDGTLWTMVGDRVVSSGVDPIEKKPLFHFLPGSLSYSIATLGCNLRCQFCQNWEISQASKTRPAEPPDPFCPSLSDVPQAWTIGRPVTPELIVEEATSHGCRSIAFTYTEPTIFFELALGVAKVARPAGLRNVFVTNGFTSPEAIRAIAPHLDGANVDLKSFDEAFYRRVCGARLAPVLDALRLYRELGVWLELTTLLIPGLNDGEEQLRPLAAFIRSELGPDVPWHVSRFFPAYRMEDGAITPESSLERAVEIGRAAGLRHIYLGNLRKNVGEDTRCPACASLVVRRRGFQVIENRLADGRCPACHAAIAGVWI